METFQAKRVKREFTAVIPASASKIFPLLCPVREYEWIDGWTCRMIYSETGVAENNCVFTTDFGRGVEEIWAVSHYDPAHYVIEFVVTSPERYVTKFDISLKESGEATTSVRFVRTFTGLTPAGNAFLEKFCQEAYAPSMDLLVKALEHFCATGKMLKRSPELAGAYPHLHGR